MSAGLFKTKAEKEQAALGAELVHIAEGILDVRSMNDLAILIEDAEDLERRCGVALNAPPFVDVLDPLLDLTTGRHDWHEVMCSLETAVAEYRGHEPRERWCPTQTTA